MNIWLWWEGWEGRKRQKKKCGIVEIGLWVDMNGSESWRHESISEIEMVECDVDALKNFLVLYNVF